MEQKYLLLIDGSSLLSTQFFGNLPREIMFAKTIEEKQKYYHKIMMTSTGTYTNGIYGFMRTLLKVCKEQKPDYLAVAWDLSRDTFRRELYPEYKGNRSETMEPLKQQFALCQELLQRMGIYQLMDVRYEADDFCGTVAKKFEQQLPVRIMTKDRDYLQLVTDQTHVWMMFSSNDKADSLYQKYQIDKSSLTVADHAFDLTPELVEAEYGVKPESISSLKGLMGDASDNIKGVSGIGEQTAVKLIQEYGTIDRLYEALEDLTPAKEKELKAYWKEKLQLKRSPIPYLTKESDTELVGEKAARLSELLATIKCDIEMPELTLDQLQFHLDREAAKTIFDELEFKSLKAELEHGWGEDAPEEADEMMVIDDYIEADIQQAKLCMEPIVGLHLVYDEGELLGMSMACGHKAYFFPKFFLMTDQMLQLWARNLASYGKRYFMDLKSVLPFMGEKCRDHLEDIGIMAYLLDPLAAAYPYDAVSEKYLHHKYPSVKDAVGKVSLKELQQTAPEQFLKLACYPALTAAQTAEKLEQMLKEQEMYDLYRNVELPLVYSLFHMEQEGVLVRKEELEAYGARLQETIGVLEQEIYDLAGKEFNINSPKQLGVILFEEMQLPYGKKTKSGYSTAADVLEKLAPDYPVVAKVLEYRQLAKLKSTYADGLAGFIQEDGRIHGKFHQTITATGRISSTDPNLQNIPVRMELGREIRKVFVPKEGCIFLDADYSQIELRVLAHMSGDENLIRAYGSAQDIHAITASQVFHVPLEEVTPLLRRNAKAVNFGIVYGISAFGLSEDLSITRKEAMAYIERYFETYPGVKTFLDGSVDQGREQGYVTTMFGRRRPIPELKSSNFMQRSFGERVAMNSPIQGTAADIMKIAMNRVDERLRREQLQSRIILQVHDELLVETRIEETEQVKQILLEEMHGAAKLAVELEISLEEGNSWFETK